MFVCVCVCVCVRARALGTDAWVGLMPLLPNKPSPYYRHTRPRDVSNVQSFEYTFALAYAFNENLGYW